MPGPAKPERPQQRTPAEIEQELDETTQRLVSRVDELVHRMQPRQVVRRGMAELKAKVVDLDTRPQETGIVEPDGRPRKEIVGAAIGALVGLAVLVWRSRRRG